MTLPDLAALAYRYDATHRLIGITDQAGNTVNYTLDASGSRTARVYNALNHLQSVTGAAQ